MICQKCEANNESHSSFCYNCGSALKEYCPICRNSHTIGFKFCTTTGKVATQAVADHKKTTALSKEFESKFVYGYKTLCVNNGVIAFFLSAIIMALTDILLNMYGFYAYIFNGLPKGFIYYNIAGVFLLALITAHCVYDWKKDLLRNQYVKSMING